MLDLLKRQINYQNGNIRGVNSRNSCRLAKGGGADLLKLGRRFKAKALDLGIIDILGQASRFDLLLLFCVGDLALDVALVFYLCFHGLANSAGKLTSIAVALRKIVIGDLGAAEQVCQLCAAGKGSGAVLLQNGICYDR